MNSDDLRQRIERDRAQAQRARREFMRWVLLMTIDYWRPADATLSSLLSVVKGEYNDATEMEVRRELDYLSERHVVSTRIDPLGQVRARLERHGIDIVQYTVDCEPGIARPPFGG